MFANVLWAQNSAWPVMNTRKYLLNECTHPQCPELLLTQWALNACRMSLPWGGTGLCQNRGDPGSLGWGLRRLQVLLQLAWRLGSAVSSWSDPGNSLHLSEPLFSKLQVGDHNSTFFVRGLWDLNVTIQKRNLVNAQYIWAIVMMRSCYLPLFQGNNVHILSYLSRLLAHICNTLSEKRFVNHTPLYTC